MTHPNTCPGSGVLTPSSLLDVVCPICEQALTPRRIVTGAEGDYLGEVPGHVRPEASK